MKIAIGPSSFASADPRPLQVLQDHGFVVVDNPYKRKLTEEETIQHLQGAVGLIAGLEPLNENVFSACPALKVIARVGIGMDNVDVQACERYGIKVSNTPDGPTQAVAELVLTALLAIGRGIIPANDALHRGEWKKNIGFSLNGLRVLVVGYGRIGKTVARQLRALGCEVKSHDPFVDSDFQTLHEGLAWAEVVSLHASGDAELIASQEIEAMRDGAVLLNSARGGLVNEQALYDALHGGKLSAAWLDVFPHEPYSGQLAGLPNLIMTPHISTYTRQCRLEMEMQAVKNLLRDLNHA